MKDFEAHHAKSRSRNMTLAAAGLGVLTLAGLGFAASGGIGALRTWFVNINVGGQTYRVAAADGENATMKIEHPDGSNTTLDVVAATLDDGNKTKIVMRNIGAGGETEEVIEQQRMQLGVFVEAGEEKSLDQVRTLPVLGQWSDGDRSVVIHAAPAEGEATGQMHIVVTGFDPDPAARVLASPTLPSELLTGKATLTVDEHGRISTSIATSDGAGDERVARLIFATSKADGEMPAIPELPGAVRVRVDDATGEIDVSIPEGATVTGSGGSPK